MAERIDVNVISEKTNVADTLPSQLMLQFEKSENILKFLSIFSPELQELESDAVIPLLYERTVLAAEGQQLDNIGEGLNIAREGRADDDYRAFLRVSALQRRSRGAIDEILTLLYFLTGIRLTHHYRGYGYYLQLGFNPTCVDNSVIISAVGSVLPIMSNVTWLNIDHERIFGLASTQADTRVPSYIKGFSSVFMNDNEISGKLSSFIQRVDRDFANSDDPRYAFGYTSTESGLTPDTSFIRGYQTVHQTVRTTTSAGEIISTTQGISSDYNRLQDDQFHDYNTQ